MKKALFCYADIFHNEALTRCLIVASSLAPLVLFVASSATPQAVSKTTVSDSSQTTVHPEQFFEGSSSEYYEDEEGDGDGGDGSPGGDGGDGGAGPRKPVGPVGPLPSPGS